MPSLDITQGGFRANRGTLDQAACLHELMCAYSRSEGGEQHPPVVAFLDIKAAYDSADRLVVRDTLRPFVTRPLLELLQNLFDNIIVKVIQMNVASREIFPRHGFLQGSILSPFLYSVFIDTLPRMLRTVSTRPQLVRVPTPPFRRSLNLAVRCPFWYNTPNASHRSLLADLLDLYNPFNFPGDLNSDPEASIPVSCLLYADDVAIIGYPRDVHNLLLAAEHHSLLLGYR
ncbi:hypothetical protein VTP01DRAFT_9293 [Rhizomucor pusillus]|uniref:uncharacterized protein n=1 Tax=Rhizomucor pusillus TaxID=4840 RepID=UPI0037448EDD